MKKRKLSQKLRLRKDTVRTLGEEAIGRVRGGASGIPACNPSNLCTLYGTCAPTHHCTQLNCPTANCTFGPECVTNGGACTG